MDSADTFKRPISDTHILQAPKQGSQVWQAAVTACNKQRHTPLLQSRESYGGRLRPALNSSCMRLISCRRRDLPADSQASAWQAASKVHLWALKR